MSKQLKDQFGLDFPQHICEKIYTSYWSLFPLVAKAKKREEDYFNRHDYITTEFGFRCHGKGVISAFNSKIQSSISSIMIIETALTLEKAPWAEWVTVIHDSSLYQIPEDKVDLFKQVKMEVENDLNSMLGWSVKILFSEHYGKDWSELK
jgi:DNA polymerase I-like protein with 3'-5' exonuclease and polymerase domains